MKYLYICVFAILLASCNSTKSVTYLQDAETLPANSVPLTPSTQTFVAMPGDLVDIIITGYNVDAVKPFNRYGVYQEVGGSSTSGNNSITSYLVDDNGDIEFPVIGKLHIGGMNKSQIKELIISELCPKYLSDKPGIDIRFKNFKISIVGEVHSPGVYTVENEKINILEAIAMAGDLTINGIRNNVMIIRTGADGSRTVHKIDLQDKNLILSPYYNLQQNDVVYVEPNASKARQSWSVPPALSLALSSVGTAISIATLIITLTK